MTTAPSTEMDSMTHAPLPQWLLNKQLVGATVEMACQIPVNQVTFVFNKSVHDARDSRHQQLNDGHPRKHIPVVSLSLVVWTTFRPISFN